MSNAMQARMFIDQMRNRILSECLLARFGIFTTLEYTSNF